MDSQSYQGHYQGSLILYDTTSTIIPQISPVIVLFRANVKRRVLSRS